MIKTFFLTFFSHRYCYHSDCISLQDITYIAETAFYVSVSIKSSLETLCVEITLHCHYFSWIEFQEVLVFLHFDEFSRFPRDISRVETVAWARLARVRFLFVERTDILYEIFANGYAMYVSKCVVRFRQLDHIS